MFSITPPHSHAVCGRIDLFRRERWPLVLFGEKDLLGLKRGATTWGSPEAVEAHRAPQCVRFSHRRAAGIPVSSLDFHRHGEEPTPRASSRGTIGMPLSLQNVLAHVIADMNRNGVGIGERLLSTMALARRSSECRTT